MKYYLITISIISTLLVSCKEPMTENAENNKYYTELHRNQFHFSPEANWMNDPNGLYFHDGEYHLFYQYYPDSTVWGPMHWGHAVSKDMVIWEHRPIALYPDSLGLIFSGSAVVDHKNTSGLGTETNPPVVAVFTHHNMEGEKAGTKTYQYQSIAFSLDKGRTFTKYQGNPVVRNPGIKDFRDPKVIWDQENKQWVMVFAAYDKVLFYTSSNLRDWTKSGEFGIEGDTRLWECPDMFPLKVEGSDEIKWVLITSILKEAPNGGTATAYFVGDWDGNAFIGDPDNLKWLDYGTDNYAFVTWSDIPESDGRRLGIGWMSNWQYAQSVPTEKWRSAMTLPRELNLHKVDDYYIVFSQPVRELKTLNEKIENIDSGTIENDVVLTNNESSGLFKINLTFENPGENAINLKFSNDKNEFLIVGYDGESKSYFIDRTQSGKTNFSDVFSVKHIFDTNYEKETIEMTIYLDHASIELFADQGRCVMTDIFFSSSPFNNVEILGSENPVQLISGQLTSLKSIWR